MSWVFVVMGYAPDFGVAFVTRVVNAAVNLPIGLWPEHEPQILSILESAVLAEGILSKEEAIAIATEECTIEYNTVDARFHSGDGVWVVNFYTQNTVGGDQTVTVDSGGSILNIVYGE